DGSVGVVVASVEMRLCGIEVNGVADCELLGGFDGAGLDVTCCDGQAFFDSGEMRLGDLLSRVDVEFVEFDPPSCVDAMQQTGMHSVTADLYTLLSTDDSHRLRCAVEQPAQRYFQGS